jgi:hypothetical protein
VERVLLNRPDAQAVCDVGDTKAQAALTGSIGSAEVPEPGTLGVFRFWAVGLAYVRRRKKKTV